MIWCIYACFRSEIALKYLSSQFQQLLTSNSILQQTSYPHTQKNGIAEHKNRHFI